MSLHFSVFQYSFPIPLIFELLKDNQSPLMCKETNTYTKQADHPNNTTPFNHQISCLHDSSIPLSSHPLFRLLQQLSTIKLVATSFHQF